MPLAEASASLKVGESGVKVVSGLHSWFRAWRANTTLVREAKEHLGISRRNVYAYRAATMHPLYQRGLPHPDNRAALVAVGGDEYKRSVREGSVAAVDELSLALSDGMVLVGSPEEEGVSRLAFGYRVRPDGGGMEYTGSPIDLPFRWEEDRTAIQATYRRFVEGRGEVERPNWPIVDERGDRRSLFPRVANDRLLDTDLLLITKVPNYLTRIGYESGRSLITIAGAHGIATRAVELLLQDRTILRTIGATLPQGASSYQLLFDVGQIRHDPQRGSRAGAIRLRECCVLDRPDSVWRTAREQVTAGYAEWLEQADRSGNIV